MAQITVSVNNTACELPADTLVGAALQQWGYPQGGLFAVAVNKTFVPREQYTSRVLQDGDEIDVVEPISGG